MCKRKGAMVTTVNKEDLKIVKGENKIKTYQFNTKVAKHHFCSECGTHTHNLRRSDPNTFGINVGCIDEIETLIAQGIGHTTIFMDTAGVAVRLGQQIFDSTVRLAAHNYIATPFPGSAFDPEKTVIMGLQAVKTWCCAGDQFCTDRRGPTAKGLLGFYIQINRPPVLHCGRVFPVRFLAYRDGRPEFQLRHL